MPHIVVLVDFRAILKFAFPGRLGSWAAGARAGDLTLVYRWRCAGVDPARRTLRPRAPARAACRLDAATSAQPATAIRSPYNHL